MDNQNPQEQAVAVEIAADATEPPINLIAKMKAAIADLSARQILKLVLLGLALIVWYPVYSRLNPFSHWVAYDLFGIAHGSHLGESVAFFLLDIPKVFMLLLLIVWAVGVIRSFFTPERTRALLAGKREFLGHGLAGALGVVTPFCSCSAVPLFIGFMEAGIPLGVTFSFLITAPMVNEIALALLLAMFGWRIALLYMATGLLIAISSGLIIGRLGMERQVEDWVYEIRMGKPPAHLANLNLDGPDRLRFSPGERNCRPGLALYHLGDRGGGGDSRLYSRRHDGKIHGEGLVVGAGDGSFRGPVVFQRGRSYSYR